MTVKITKPEINVREKLNELKKPTGVAGEAMLRAETPQEQFNLIGAGRRNLIINGGFTVSQRGSYTSATAMTTNNYVFGVDRWNNNTSNVAATFQQLTGYPTANENYMRLVATSTTSGYYRMFQRVEGNFEGRVLTFSAWVKSNDSDARLITIATGAWVSNDKSAKHSGNGQWEKLTLTVTAGNFANPHFVISNTTATHGNTAVTIGDYIEVANCQLELGTVATPFEHRSYGEELALCQRYCNVLAPNVTYAPYGYVGFCESTTRAKVIYNYPVTMRAAPTFTRSGSFMYDGATSNPTFSSQNNVSNTIYSSRIEDNVTGAAQGQGIILLNLNDANATITLEAEL